MPLTPGRRTPEVTHARMDPWLVAQRVALGGTITAGAITVVYTVHGLGSLHGIVLAIPGLYTLVAARRPWVAPCPACGHTLGTSALALPDEPVVSPRGINIRCPDCGIYVDTLDLEVREVPFNRLRDAPEYTLSMAANALEACTWGENCLCCGHPSSRGVTLGGDATGLLSVPTVTGKPLPAVLSLPFCERHGTSSRDVSETVIVARTDTRATVQFRLYAAYRGFLDANRDRVDIRVRS